MFRPENLRRNGNCPFLFAVRSSPTGASLEKLCKMKMKNDPTLAWPMVAANSVPIVKESCSAEKNEKEMLCGRHVIVHEVHEVCE